MKRSLALLALLTLAACNQAGLTPTEMIVTETESAAQHSTHSATVQTTGTPDHSTGE